MIKELLTELKKVYGAKGIKIELSSERLTDEEWKFLKSTADELSMFISIKTAGAEDERGIFQAVNIGAQNIVVPMTESSYALSKFISLVKKQSSDINIFANIETINGYKNIDEILKTCSKNIEGIVFGRNDFCSSLGLTSKDINSETIFEYAKELSLKANVYNLKFYAGGNVCKESVPFFGKLPYLTGFETRKIIFDVSSMNNISELAVNKALNFELLWLQSKHQDKFDFARIEVLKERFLC